MQVRNNYDIMWRGKDNTDTGMGIFNGDIGVIVKVDNRDEVITVDFEGPDGGVHAGHALRAGAGLRRHGT